jgi:hypothetical protein
VQLRGWTGSSIWYRGWRPWEKEWRGRDRRATKKAMITGRASRRVSQRSPFPRRYPSRFARPRRLSWSTALRMTRTISRLECSSPVRKERSLLSRPLLQPSPLSFPRHPLQPPANSRQFLQLLRCLCPPPLIRPIPGPTPVHRRSLDRHQREVPVQPLLSLPSQKDPLLHPKLPLLLRPRQPLLDLPQLLGNLPHQRSRSLPPCRSLLDPLDLPPTPRPTRPTLLRAERLSTDPSLFLLLLNRLLPSPQSRLLLPNRPSLKANPRYDTGNSLLQSSLPLDPSISTAPKPRHPPPPPSLASQARRVLQANRRARARCLSRRGRAWRGDERV